MVKLFQLPSFEEWRKNDYEFKETIGEFTCVFHRTGWYLNSSTTDYQCAIAPCDNPTNIYVDPVVSWHFRCDSTDTDLLEQRYYETVREVHSRWIHFVESTYLTSNGTLQPEFISLRSILVTAFCASSKREFTVDEINQLLKVIHDKIHDQDGKLQAYVDVPDSVDSHYLEKTVMSEYYSFRMTKDFNGIRADSEANLSQLYFKWEIKNSLIRDIIKDFYSPDDYVWG